MDLTVFNETLKAHTAALMTHSVAIEKLIASAGGSPASVTGVGSSASMGNVSGDVTPITRGPGRPRKAAETGVSAAPTSAAVQTAQIASIANTNLLDVGNQPAPAATAPAAALTHASLVPLFKDFAIKQGRDKIVALLDEFGVAEFGKVKLEDLPLFRDRLSGKPQTPVAASDAGDLLGSLVG